MRNKGKKDKLKQDKHQKYQKPTHEKKLKEEELGKINGGMAIRVLGGADSTGFTGPL